MEKNSLEIICPMCKSASLSANKENFSQTRAAIGAAAFGAQGMLYGLGGSNNVVITCLACGYNFKPGEGATETDFEAKNKIAKQKVEQVERRKQNRKLVVFLMLMAIAIFIIWLYNSIVV